MMFNKRNMIFSIISSFILLFFHSSYAKMTLEISVKNTEPDYGSSFVITKPGGRQVLKPGETQILFSKSVEMGGLKLGEIGDKCIASVTQEWTEERPDYNNYGPGKQPTKKVSVMTKPICLTGYDMVDRDWAYLRIEKGGRYEVKVNGAGVGDGEHGYTIKTSHGFFTKHGKLSLEVKEK